MTLKPSQAARDAAARVWPDFGDLIRDGKMDDSALVQAFARFERDILARDGWVMVPREPTEAMLEAGADAWTPGASADAEQALVSDQAAAFDTFWSKVAMRGPDNCWLWQKALRGGYGVYWNGAKNVAAHRFAVLISGRAIPDGMVVDHICRNRACVNPGHLRVVTRRQNVHENSQALAHLKSLQTHCTHGHELTPENLRNRPGKRLCRACERQWQRDYRAKQKAARNG